MHIQYCYSRFDFPNFRSQIQTMHHAVFFTFYFWFSHSSPKAVE
jgi:hypothetical protein